MRERKREKILFCASEVYPFVKTGGLADVAHALPRALLEEYEIDVVLPLYQNIDKEKFSIAPLAQTFTLLIALKSYQVSLFESYYEGVHYLFIYEPLLCEREFLYGKPNAGYSDNALRFALFCHTIVALLQTDSYSVAHLNDWQCGLVPLLLQESPHIKTKTILTIHNLAYQGVFPFEDLIKIGIDKRHFHMEALEFYGKINFLKAGVAYCDALTTVSKEYAKEILTPAFGCGLDGLLYHHRAKLTGILNGIDSEHFHPAIDRLIPQTYDSKEGKIKNKKIYLKANKFRGINKPLFAFVGRITQQKGITLLIEVLESLATHPCHIVILGEGEIALQRELQEVAKKHTNIRLFFEYDETHSHLVYASADFLLMPSLFEPCGLNQMIAMNYGTLPIIHKVGGLKESVQNYKYYNAQSKKGFGIVFLKPTKKDFLDAILEAFVLYETKKEYNALVRHNMACDFSWSQSAQKYSTLYKKLSRK